MKVLDFGIAKFKATADARALPLTAAVHVTPSASHAPQPGGPLPVDKGLSRPGWVVAAILLLVVVLLVLAGGGVALVWHRADAASSEDQAGTTDEATVPAPVTAPLSGIPDPTAQVSAPPPAPPQTPQEASRPALPGAPAAEAAECAQLRAQRDSAMQRYERLRMQYTEQWPDVRTARAEVETVKARLRLQGCQ